MSQSYLKDIQQVLGEKAEDYLKELNYDPFENTKNQVKSMFSYLQDEDIIEILKKYNNNTEDAFDELMGRNSQIEENKKRERQLEEEKRKLEIYNKYIDTFVKNFQMFDKKEIEEAFKNNNNDPQLTSKQLYLMIKEREQKNEEAKKLKREMEIQNMQSGFSEKFAELSKEEILEVIKQNDLNFEKIAFDLEKMQKQKIFDELFLQYYTSFSSEEIREALEKNNWVKVETKKVLQKKQSELEFKKQIEIIEKEKLKIPKLEYSEKQLENLKEESKSKMIDVKKIVEIAEVQNEEETKKNIENMIIENSNQDIPQNVSQNECSIEVTVQDTKIVAHVDFKNQNSYSWIGFYSKEDKDPNYKFYNYLCKLTENKFVVDKPLLNGTYQFRVFLSKYVSVKISEDIVLDKKDFVKMVRDEKNDKVTVVSWEMGSVDPYSVSAYVTIHKKEEERANYYRRWNWMKTFSGSHSFKTPIHTGEYEARVYFGGKLQFKSDSFKIEGI